ncbi:MAG: hypothetical protein NZM29_05670, partial [Nitrospira sp.]|nr:hypothetical protein [Nitrospira sp.]
MTPDAVAASIPEFGFRQPIVVAPDGGIIVGHTGHKAAVKLGLDIAYRIADNKSAELSTCGIYDLLPIELAGLQEKNYDLGLARLRPGRAGQTARPRGEGRPVRPRRGAGTTLTPSPSPASGRGEIGGT